ncbi:MAG: 50S ribosomal protein L10 [Gammaproteobacteria bacterium]
MALNLDQKKSIVAEVAAVAAKAHSAVAAEYRGLSVVAMTALRSEGRKNGVYVRVVKNTLARRAVEGTDFACMQDGLVGPLILAFSKEEPGAAARLMQDFAKANEKMVIKLVSFGGKMLAPGDIDRLSKMPTREQALSMLMGVLQAPITKLVRTLAEPNAKMVRTFAALRDKREAA